MESVVPSPNSTHRIRVSPPIQESRESGLEKVPRYVYIHIGDVKNSSSILASTSVVVQTAHEPKSPHPPGTRAAERIPPLPRVCETGRCAHTVFYTVRPSVHHPRPHVPANAVRCGADVDVDSAGVLRGPNGSRSLLL
jgi:hypothetical protein